MNTNFATETDHDEEEDILADDACPGCGCRPGDGLTEGCNDPDGCGFSRLQIVQAVSK